jgi:hypothetical protein
MDLPITHMRATVNGSLVHKFQERGRNHAGGGGSHVLVKKLRGGEHHRCACTTVARIAMPAPRHASTAAPEAEERRRGIHPP